LNEERQRSAAGRANARAAAAVEQQAERLLQQVNDGTLAGEVIAEENDGGHRIVDHQFSEVLIDQLMATFNKGFFQCHHTWTDQLRNLVTSLMVSMVDDVGNREIHTAAFFVLGGLLQAMKVLKKPFKPYPFIQKAIGFGRHASKFILHQATLVQDHMESLQRSRRRSNGRVDKVRALTKRAKKLFKDGRYSAATVALEEAKNWKDNPNRVVANPLSLEEVQVKLRTLNPQRREGDEVPAEDENPTGRLRISADVVGRVMRNLSKGSANGASGWTCATIYRLYGGCDSGLGEHHDKIANLFTLLASGELPAKYWNWSRAVLIPKDDGGFRPLGIGETWYRILGKCILQVVAAKVGEGLKPVQLGCGIRGGCEIAARLSQLFLDTDPTQILLKTDFKNAFNLVPRGRIYEGLCLRCPELRPWFRWAYGEQSPLFDSEGKLVCTSETGCRQGDPLAALLFCVAIQDAVLEIQQAADDLYEEAVADGRIQSNSKRGHVVAYMDDCTISVHRDLAPAMCEKIREICRTHGLVLNEAKCRAFGNRAVDAEGLFKATGEGSIVLGVPVGSNAFRGEACKEALGKHGGCLPAFDDLKIGSIMTVNLIKYCINMRASYLTRVGDTPALREVGDFDTKVDMALLQTLNHCQDGKEYVVRGQVVPRKEIFCLLRSLPASEGGMGIHRHSWIFGQKAILKSRQRLKEFIDDDEDGRFQEFHRHLESYEELEIGTFGCPFPFAEDSIHMEDAESNQITEDGEYTDLNEVSRNRFTVTANQTVQYLRQFVSLQRAAMFVSNRHEGSGRWISPPIGITQAPHLAMDNEAYRLALRQRMLLDIFEDVWFDGQNDQICSHCQDLRFGYGYQGEAGHGSESEKQDAFHHLNCNVSCKRFNIMRHTEVKKAVMSYLNKRLNVRIVNEPTVIDNSAPESRKRADIMVMSRRNLQWTRILDVVVSNPAARSLLPANPQQPLVPNMANKHHETLKANDYAQVALPHNSLFVPFAVELSGRIGEEAGNALTFMLGDESSQRDAQAARRVARNENCLYVSLQAQIGTILAKLSGERARKTLAKVHGMVNDRIRNAVYIAA
jgi:hypothetical protein